VATIIQGRTARTGIVVLVAVLATATAISQFYRNSVGVIATTLVGELQLTADQLGTITASFFLIFALCQIPVGIVIDRWGPRVAILGSSAFVVAGSLAFASAEGEAGLVAGRVLLGIGCSTFLMAPLVIYARAFPPRTFATLAGIQLSISSFGTLGATVPLAYATATAGWRSAFVAAGLFAALFALAVFIVVRGPAAGPAASNPRESLRETLAGVGEAVRVKGFWPLFLMSFAAYSTFGLIVGLWGGPYLAHVHGVDLSAQGRALFIMAAAQIAGTLAWGAADRLVGAYRPVTVTGAAISVILMIVLILFGHGGPPGRVEVIYGMIGFFCAFTPILVAHGKALFPPHITGRGLSLLNIGTMSGGFTTQWLTGLAVKAIAGSATIYPPSAFQAAFAMQAMLLAVATLWYCTAPDPRRNLG
jgi:MFS family permease